MVYGLILVGDIHGDVNIMVEALRRLFNESNDTRLIFLGDYIDRGTSSAYIYLLMDAIMRSPYNDRVIFIRGNHEAEPGLTYDVYRNDGMSCTRSWLYDLFHELPLVPYYYDEEYNIMCSHGKLFVNLSDLPNIAKHEPYAVSVGIDNRKTNFVDNYLNVHGHIHRGTNPEVVKNMIHTHLTEHELVVPLSIDYDNSFGIRTVEMYLRGERNVNNKGTQVKYVFIHNKFDEVEFVDTVPNVNFNNTMFNDIVHEYLPQLEKYIRDKPFEFLHDVLNECAKTNVSIEWLKQNFHNNISANVQSRETFTYYDDVPKELFIRMSDYDKSVYGSSNNIFLEHICVNNYVGGVVKTKSVCGVSVIAMLIGLCVIVICLIVIVIYCVLKERQNSFAVEVV